MRKSILAGTTALGIVLSATAQDFETGYITGKAIMAFRDTQLVTITALNQQIGGLIAGIVIAVVIVVISVIALNRFCKNKYYYAHSL